VRDPEVAALLADNPRRACERLGIDIGATNLVVLANTPEVHNLVRWDGVTAYHRSPLLKQLVIPWGWHPEAVSGDLQHRA
jgi:hypothetical protein